MAWLRKISILLALLTCGMLHAQDDGPALDPQVWEELAEDLDYWEPPPEEIKLNPNTGGSAHSGLKVLFVVVLILLIGLLIHFVVNVSAGKRKGSVHEEDVADEDLEPEELDLALQRALQAGAYRKALRYLYLKGLRYLDDRALIRYQREKTNSRYMLELMGTSAYEPFRLLTLQYERAWYGHAMIVKADFDKAEGWYKEFNTAA